VRRHELGLLDTGTLILLGRLADAADLPVRSLISTVSLAELSVGPLVAGTETERSARQAHLQHAETSFEALPFDADAARMFGQVAAALRRAGRKPAARTFDAMIAAMALARQLPLYTANPADFAGIDGLTVVPVPIPPGPPPEAEEAHGSSESPLDPAGRVERPRS
jgi:hypothetical protein